MLNFNTTMETYRSLWSVPKDDMPPAEKDAFCHCWQHNLVKSATWHTASAWKFQCCGWLWSNWAWNHDRSLWVWVPRMTTPLSFWQCVPPMTCLSWAPGLGALTTIAGHRFEMMDMPWKELTSSLSEITPQWNVTTSLAQKHQQTPIIY